MNTQTHVLPAAWAGLLVNGSVDGMPPEEVEQATNWLDINDLSQASVISCSDHQFDDRIMLMAGDSAKLTHCMNYTFSV